MSKELAITLEDKPGTLAKLTEALGAAGVNIETFFVAPGPKSNCRILVDDPVAARKAIEGAGLKVDSEREALAVELDDQAGSLGRIARKLANAQVNMQVRSARGPECIGPLAQRPWDSKRFPGPTGSRAFQWSC